MENSKSFDYHESINNADWLALRDVMWPYIHADDPSSIPIPDFPPHLADHPLIHNIQKFKDTGNDKYLDRAGQILCPTDEPFGWYVILTK